MADQSQEYYSTYTTIFNKMKDYMNTAPNTGNVNLYFILEMTPHHEDGIDMSRAIIEYGINENVKKSLKILLLLKKLSFL